MSITSLLNLIANREIVLPAIQRDFVWEEEKAEKLFDSIMRKYPIGMVLLWETYEDIQYRPFLKDFRPGQIHAYRDNTLRRRLKLVLDGQQRLQALYIGLHGTLEGKRLHLDALSGESSDDVAEERFLFYFLAPEEAREWNDSALEEAKLQDDSSGNPTWVIAVGDVFAMSGRQKKDLVRQLETDLRLTDDQSVRLDLNLGALDEALTKDENILRVSTIDENLPGDSPDRQSDADVLEIFFRINREGTPLSRSDLIFSMLKLNWRESAEALPQFVRTVNEGNSFDIDTDFVIRCLFVVSDLGSRLDLGLLRKKSNVQSLRGNFQPCCDAIRAAVDFVQSEASCSSGPVLGGLNTLVPFVYYFFRLPKHEPPSAAVDEVRKALYLFAFARPFSRYADSRIGAFVRGEMRPVLADGRQAFPLEAAIRWVRRWERVDSVESLAERNVLLALHLVQGLTGAKVQYTRNSPEVDHIFPRAQLRKKGVPEDLINNFANFWILAKGKNRNKSDRHPRDFFKDVSDRQLKQALIDRDMLDYRRFTTFLEARREAMLERLRRRLDLKDQDLASTTLPSAG